MHALLPPRSVPTSQGLSARNKPHLPQSNQSSVKLGAAGITLKLRKWLFGLSHAVASTSVATSRHCGVKRPDDTSASAARKRPFLVSLVASLNKIFLDYNLLESTQINMCDIQVTTYASCRRNPQHQVRGDYLRCAAARARPNQQLCMPASGQLRDLPLSLDAQDTNVQGECPICNARTPSNSSD